MTNLPMVVMTKAQMIAAATHWVDLIKQILSSEAAHHHSSPRHQRTPQGWNNRNDERHRGSGKRACRRHIASRQLATEMIDNVGAEMTVVLKNCVQRALMRPDPHPIRSSSHKSHIWLRNVGIAILVDVACKAWGLHYSRNRSPASEPVKPAGSTVIVAALKRHRSGPGTRTQNVRGFTGITRA